MEKIKSIIIDDEPGSISNLKYHLSEYCPGIEVVNTESDLARIPAALQENVDVAFLDIEICQNNIFNLLQQAGKFEFDIVFVTAYEQYALKAFNVDVLDYLLKPIRKDSIINCYNKILKRFSHIASIPEGDEQHAALPASKNVVLRQGEHIYVVAMDEVVFFEAKGAYTNICIVKDGKRIVVTVSKTLAQIAMEYVSPLFLKIHRSFIINKSKVAEITRKGTPEVIMHTGDTIPVARRRWVDFLSATNI